MGLLDFLIERDEPEIDKVMAAEILEQLSEPEVEEVEVENTELTNLINNIYAENNLEDKSASIFKVLEAIEALPAEMPMAQKVASVISILKISGLNEDIVINDAMNRIDVLKGSLQFINNKYADEIANAKADIAMLEDSIAKKQQLIYEVTITDEESTKAINGEIGIIEGLIKFLGKE